MSRDKITIGDMIGKEVTMLRIASVFTSTSQMLVTTKRPQPPARKPMVPPVTPPAALRHLPPELTAAQSEAAFAVAVSRNAPPPMALGELSLPADPLPDLPALGIAAPDPDAFAAQKATADAAHDQPPTGPTPHLQNASPPATPAPVPRPTAVTPQPPVQASLAEMLATR
jgi:hypothetical protein